MILDKPLFTYDSDCGFCDFWIKRWKNITGDAINYSPYVSAKELFSGISMEELSSAVHLFMPDKKVYKGAEAVFRAFALNGRYTWVLWIYKHIWGARYSSEWFYRWVSHHREFLYRVMRFFRLL
ncbi:MAG TPA: DCC1-like thiol-disulfide oxidoreductase family protein [Candidatus Paceibacterota bacterium]